MGGSSAANSFSKSSEEFRSALYKHLNCTVKRIFGRHDHPRDLPLHGPLTCECGKQKPRGTLSEALITQVHHRATGARREAPAAHDSSFRRHGQKFLADQRLFMGRLEGREDKGLRANRNTSFTCSKALAR